MPSDLQTIGPCPHCSGTQLTCKYNLFESGDLRIDSWEHRCPDCGHRETTAYRSDEPDTIADGVDSTICPYCGRSGPD